MYIKCHLSESDPTCAQVSDRVEDCGVKV